MDTSALIFMVVILGVIWGGAIYFILKANKQEGSSESRQGG